MNTIEITRALEADEHTRKHFRCVSPVDRLPNDVSRGLYVINTSPEWISEFGHWVAMFNGEFFCSYGNRPELYGLPRARRYNKKRLQQTNSEVCGLYVITYAKVRARGHTLCDMLRCFPCHGHDSAMNDLMIRLVSRMQEQ